jgi:hypothetical protein
MRSIHGMETTTSPHGPDRATFKHWLDRETRPVIGACAFIRECRRKHGAPLSIWRKPDCAVYTWQSGFDRFAVTVYRLISA